MDSTYNIVLSTSEIKATVIEKLKEYFDKYYGLITDDMGFDTKYEDNTIDMGLMMVAEEHKYNV